VAETYTSLKVTISRLDDKKYLSLLDSDLEGVGGGQGQEFALDPEAPPSGAPKLSRFLNALATGGVPSASFIELFGKWLFDCAFGGEHQHTYKTAVTLAQSKGHRLRICMNVLTSDLIDVPWEYLHDHSGFVIKSGPAIVRLLEGVAAPESSFAPVQNLLLCVASPKSEDYDPFDGDAHLKAVLETLKGIGGLTVTPLLHPSPEAIEQALRQNKFDAFYFIGHGIHLKDGGGQLVCENQGEPAFLAADNLSAWIRESHSLRFVYLNSCSTAVTSGANPIQGVAQRLMREGRVSAVAAMQADVKQASAQSIAESFFKLLRDNKSPEDAMLLSRTKAGDLYSFGIPVLYSTVDAPAQFEKNKLAAFLSMEKGSSCALLLPSWIPDLPGKAGAPANLKSLDGDQLYYGGPTFATADVKSAWSIANLVRSVLPPDKIRIWSNEDVGELSASHKFVFGSQSRTILTGVRKLFEPELSFDFDPADAPGYRVIRDAKNGNCYEIRKDLDYATYQGTADYGVIQKFTDRDSKRVYFLIAGLGSRATEGCGFYFREHWAELLREFGNQDFGIVVMFPEGFGAAEGRRLVREAGKKPCSEVSQRLP
jgi:hypothetical protein